MTDHQAEQSAWIARTPGMADASRDWLAGLDDRLAAAERRAGVILGTPVFAPAAIARMGRLVADTAPKLAPALVARDGDAIVKSLSQLAIRGGPTYVKLGQLIATTRGLVPDAITDAFAGCRDAVPPAPSAAIASTLRRSGILDALRSWDREPIASASVAQVHAAVLNDGTEVVIKVRRPGIVGVVASDAAYLMPALQFAESRDERLRVANLSGTLDLMLRLFAQECDLVLEATSAVQLALAFEKAGVDVHVPAPLPGLVTKRVMVMERVHGVSAADVEGSAKFGHVAADIVRLAIAGVLETTLVDGIFHGDLHPGNVLITESGMSLVDFGIVGRLTQQQRMALVRLLPAAFAEDRTGIVEALEAFGALPEGVDASGFLSILPTPPTEEERLQMMNDRDFLEQRIRMLLRAVSAAGFKAPPQLTLFFKNILYLGDAVARHAPDMDVIAETSAAVLRVASKLGAA